MRCLAIPSAGDVTLGFSFREPVEADALAQRLPPALARHAAVALALVTHTLATERELAGLRAGRQNVPASSRPWPTSCERP